ncbi:N utilization substance protein B [Clostridia bacterium]|nr:N utilization substance protein B [Clostridia bacterium]
MSRRKAREIVLCLVFEKEYQKESDCEKLYSSLYESERIEEVFGVRSDKDSLTDTDNKYIKETFSGICEHLSEIDEVISNSVIGWETGRISKITMALLRSAVYELQYAGDVPTSVTINEAVELSKRYDSADAYVFVNGVLGAVAKNIGQEVSAAHTAGGAT